MTLGKKPTLTLCERHTSDPLVAVTEYWNDFLGRGLGARAASRVDPTVGRVICSGLEGTSLRALRLCRRVGFPALDMP